jgi:hypothetical protein
MLRGSMRSRLLVALVLCLAGVGTAVPAAPSAGDASSARALTLTRARTAAYNLARHRGAAAGAVYAVAGFCKRQSTNRVNCWGAVVFANYDAAAQRVAVRKHGSRVTATTFGRLYTGNIGQKPASQSGGEWAVCGIHQSVCVGS